MQLASKYLYLTISVTHACRFRSRSFPGSLHYDIIVLLVSGARKEATNSIHGHHVAPNALLLVFSAPFCSFLLFFLSFQRFSRFAHFYKHLHHQWTLTTDHRLPTLLTVFLVVRTLNLLSSIFNALLITLSGQDWVESFPIRCFPEALTDLPIPSYVHLCSEDLLQDYEVITFAILTLAPAPRARHHINQLRTCFVVIFFSDCIRRYTRVLNGKGGHNWYFQEYRSHLLWRRCYRGFMALLSAFFDRRQYFLTMDKLACRRVLVRVLILQVLQLQFYRCSWFHSPNLFYLQSRFLSTATCLPFCGLWIAEIYP